MIIETEQYMDFDNERSGSVRVNNTYRAYKNVSTLGRALAFEEARSNHKREIDESLFIERFNNLKTTLFFKETVLKEIYDFDFLDNLQELLLKIDSLWVNDVLKPDVSLAFVSRIINKELNKFGLEYNCSIFNCGFDSEIETEICKEI